MIRLAVLAFVLCLFPEVAQAKTGWYCYTFNYTHVDKEGKARTTTGSFCARTRTSCLDALVLEKQSASYMKGTIQLVGDTCGFQKQAFAYARYYANGHRTFEFGFASLADCTEAAAVDTDSVVVRQCKLTP